MFIFNMIPPKQLKFSLFLHIFRRQDNFGFLSFTKYLTKFRFSKISMTNSGDSIEITLYISLVFPNRSTLIILFKL